MELSELEATPEQLAKEGEIVDDFEEAEEEDDEDTTEADLQNALLILGDVQLLLGVINRRGTKEWPKVIDKYIASHISKLNRDIDAFLAEFDSQSQDEVLGI